MVFYLCSQHHIDIVVFNTIILSCFNKCPRSVYKGDFKAVMLPLKGMDPTLNVLLFFPQNIAKPIQLRR